MACANCLPPGVFFAPPHWHWASFCFKETVSKKYIDIYQPYSPLAGSVGVISGLKEHYPRHSVLHLDAHADLRDEYEGLKLSHACVARRVYEMAPVVEVGIQSLSLVEAEFLRKEELPLYYASELIAGSTPWEEIVERLSDTVYVSIDLDVFDPSLMPAVGSHEPGGLGWYDTIENAAPGGREKEGCRLRCGGVLSH